LNRHILVLTFVCFKVITTGNVSAGGFLDGALNVLGLESANI